ncbi:MAG: hypothetical protein VKO00_05290 [Cyanobacteriota bacterium]|nr:hypothetical protein [Cyanobacteriota bacterium]
MTLDTDPCPVAQAGALRLEMQQHVDAEWSSHNGGRGIRPGQQLAAVIEHGGRHVHEVEPVADTKLTVQGEQLLLGRLTHPAPQAEQRTAIARLLAGIQQGAVERIADRTQLMMERRFDGSGRMKTADREGSLRLGCRHQGAELGIGLGQLHDPILKEAAWCRHRAGWRCDGV